MLAQNVAGLLKSPPGASRDVEIDDATPRLGDEIGVSGRVQGRARLMRIPNGVFVRCDLRVGLETECARCLEPFTLDVDCHFEEEFRQTINIVTGAALSPLDDAALAIDEHHILDLTEIARQYLLGDVPFNPICTDDCRGLCAQCGRNLNQGSCDCALGAGQVASLAGLVRAASSELGRDHVQWSDV